MWQAHIADHHVAVFFDYVVIRIFDDFGAVTVAVTRWQRGTGIAAGEHEVGVLERIKVDEVIAAVKDKGVGDLAQNIVAGVRQTT